MGMAGSGEGCFQDRMGSAVTGVVEENVAGIGSCDNKIWMEGREFGG